MDMDEEDFVFYGTPIEREEELTSRKKKAVAEASGHLRTLPSWKQEVRDEEGRRRFHGAFTGGFSAGYYNTAGSKEGWTPQSFTSSRKSRAEVKQQNILNFLDDDEKAELEGRSLGTSSQFDTFGFTAAEYARKQAEKEQQQRPSIIPGPVPDEMVVPATESIGVKLLQKMGWRHGHSIKDAHANLYDARREARKAFLAFSSDHQKAEDVDAELVDDELESSVGHPTVDDVPSSQSTPVYVLNPKQDLYGLGYDPYKNAPEFREKKRSRELGNSEPGKRKALSMKESLFGFKSGKAAPGFGIGALEEYDNEDEDVYSTAYDFEDTDMQEVEEPSRSSMDHKPKLLWKEQGILPGFRVASNSDYQLQRFDAPATPKDFVPHHKFPGPLECDKKQNVPPPPEVPPPEDGNLRILIEGVATLVARCGKLFEDLSREKNQSNPSFGFLNGGNGYDYYTRKLWEEQEKQIGQKRLILEEKSSLSAQKMNAESRGKILGEMPLDRSARDLCSSVTSADINLQFNLSDTFTKPASISELPEVAKPFKDDPAKQERFEQFLKEKYHGGLRSMRSSGNSNMSEAARARERLDFEATAEAIEKGRLGKDSKPFSEQVLDFAVSGSMKFTSGGLEKGGDTNAEDMMTKKNYPKREEIQWRPSPILCKRFDLIDPYMGKPPPPPRIKSKMDSLMFTLDSGKATKVEDTIGANRDQLSTFKSDASEVSEGVTAKENEVEVEFENLERPVDLYKAIFSDDSDEEVEASSINRVDDPQKKAEVAQTTLNRLMAGDFLESLGKELGLEVPPDLPISSLNKAGTSGSQKETAADAGNADSLPVGSFHSPSSGTVAFMSHRMLHQEETAKEDESGRNKHIDGDLLDNSLQQGHGPSSDISGKVDVEKIVQDNRKANLSPGRHRKSSTSSSSDDERSRKRSRRHRHRDSDLHSDSSSDYQERYHSKSKGRNKESSQERRRYKDSDSHSDSSSDDRERYFSRSKGRNKESSQEKRSHRKHSKHRKHRSGDSLRRSSHYGTEREHLETKKEKRKRRD